MTELDLTLWYKLLKDFGPWGVVLLMLWRWGPKAGAWLAENFVSPLRDAAIAHLKTVDNSLKGMQRSVSNIDEHQTRMTNRQDTIAVNQQVLAQHQEKMTGVMVDAIGGACSLPNCPLIGLLETVRQRQQRHNAAKQGADAP